MTRDRSWIYSVLFALGMPGLAVAGQVELVSNAAPNYLSATPDGDSFFSAISADGRYVVFTSEAVNVIPGQKDTNGRTDVFLRDQIAGTTVLVSRSSESASSTGNAFSGEGQISADGRYVLFASQATNLVAGQIDTPDTFDVFLHDRVTGMNALVSRSSASARKAGNGFSVPGAISADGRYVVFSSGATDLVSGQIDPKPGSGDVFVYDRAAGTTALVSRAAGMPTKAGNSESLSTGRRSISADGGQILFYSSATDLLPGGGGGQDKALFLFNRLTGTATLVTRTFRSPSQGVTFGADEAALSADGNYIAFVTQGGDVVPDLPDPGGRDYLYLYHRPSAAVVRVTRTASDTAGGLSLSADGRFLAFFSNAQGLAVEQSGHEFRYDVFLYDRVSADVSLVSRSLTDDSGPDAFSGRPTSISADGRFVVYPSFYKDLVPGQVDHDFTTDLFLYDRTSRTNQLVSHSAASATTATGGPSTLAAISADGRFIAFDSFLGFGGALVEGARDFNRAIDVFLYDRRSDTHSVVSLGGGATPATTVGTSLVRAISADGRFVLLHSDSPNLVSGQDDVNHNLQPPTGSDYDVFLYDRNSKLKTLVSRSAESPTTTGNGPSEAVALSPDGRYALFVSQATDLVSGQVDLNGGPDLFLFDRSNGSTRLVSHRPASPQTAGDGLCSAHAEISADGRYIAFACLANDLVPGQNDDNAAADIFLYDRVAASTVLVSHAAGSATKAISGDPFNFALSADGRFVAFASFAADVVPGQTSSPFLNNNVFLFDRITGTTALVSHAPSSPAAVGNGRSDRPAISADGRYVAFRTAADNLGAAGRGAYLFDRLAGSLAHVGPFDELEMSADGRFIASISTAPNVIPGQIDSNRLVDVFLFDRLSGVTTLVSHANGRPTTTGNQTSSFAWLSLNADGSSVAFSSNATNLIPGFLAAPVIRTTNIFLYRRDTGATELVSRGLDSPLRSGDDESARPFVSADGQFVAFESAATHLTPGHQDHALGVFLYSRESSTPSGPVPLPPCTLLDTRRLANGPALRSDVRRTLKVTGACGVPSTAMKVSVKVTVLQPSGKGNLRFYPGNSPSTAPPSAILRFSAGETRTASFTLPLATNGTGTLSILPFVAKKGTVHVTVEVNGYSR